ncbi:hypothetical protein MASR1M66_10660 [Aminivibrio sp.]
MPPCPDIRKISEGLDLVKKYLAENADLAKTFTTSKTSYMGLVKDGNLEMYDGRIRLRSPRGRITDEFDDTDYLAHIGEHVEDWAISSSLLPLPRIPPRLLPYPLGRLQRLRRHLHPRGIRRACGLQKDHGGRHGPLHPVLSLCPPH